MTHWVSVKLREETHKDLVQLAGAMQEKLKRRVGIDEVVRESLKSARESEAAKLRASES